MFGTAVSLAGRQFPQWLTGRTDELGVRICTYSYDIYGLLQRSAGPGSMNVVDFTVAVVLSIGTALSILLVLCNLCPAQQEKFFSHESFAYDLGVNDSKMSQKSRDGWVMTQK